MATITAKLFTLSVEGSPAEVEVLSANTLFQVVDGVFDACGLRPGETAEDHLWDMKIGNTGKKFYYTPFEQDPATDAASTELGDLGSAIKKGTTFHLKYDYGSTSRHTFTVLSTKTVKNPDFYDFPRRKPEAPIRFKPFSADEVDIDEEFPILSHWCCEFEGTQEVNFFQAGRKHSYGFFLNEDVVTGHMIYLADKPQSLNHYMGCLNVGAGVQSSGHYDWHSIVVLPTGSKKIQKYSQDLREGFIDCKVVPNIEDGEVPDLAKVFPKVAALAGYRKDKTVKKGWIHYKSNTLMVVTGSGGQASYPNAPRGTCYDGAGFHTPGPDDKILLRCQYELGSLHHLFCTVEGFLRSL